MLVDMGAQDMAAGTYKPVEAGYEPGTEEFARYAASLDTRSLGYRLVKRAFDIAFSGCVIAVGAIPCAILSIAIAADTKGSPIYTQIRVGWSIIGQKSGVASDYALRPALSALGAPSACHPRARLGVVA